MVKRAEAVDSIENKNDIFTLKKTVSKNIRKKIIDKNMTSRDLAEKSGVSALHISFILNQRRLPSWSLLINISNVLDCKITDLLKCEDAEEEKLSTFITSIKQLISPK